MFLQQYSLSARLGCSGDNSSVECCKYCNYSCNYKDATITQDVPLTFSFPLLQGLSVSTDTEVTSTVGLRPMSL